MKNFKMLLCALFIGGAFALPLEAGVLMVSKNKSNEDPAEAITIKAYLDKDRMRVETAGKAEQSRDLSSEKIRKFSGLLITRISLIQR